MMNDKALVLLSDFGMTDGAVAAMYGVANREAPQLKIFDLTHEISPFNIWEASYRLVQNLEYWAEGTVFVCVVDPGVGTDRESVLVKTKSGHYIATPDNGVLTHVSKQVGIVERREISEAVERAKDKSKPFTYHGRDVFALTGAKLASGKISFEDVGKKLPAKVKVIDFQLPSSDGLTVSGLIDIHDKRYGSLWTNISSDLFSKDGKSFGDLFHVEISRGNKVYLSRSIPYCRSFGDVSVGEILLYPNSLMNVSVAINQVNLSETYGIASGSDWLIKIKKVK